MAILSTNPALRAKHTSIDEIRKISDPVDFMFAAADYLQISPFAIPPSFPPGEDLLCGKKAEQWAKIKALPVAKTAGRLTVAFSDPFDLPAKEEVARWSGERLWQLVAVDSEIQDVLTRLKNAEDASNPALAMENIMKGDEADVEISSVSDQKSDEIDSSVDAAGEAPVIRMVNTIMIEAL